ncbi:MAG: patatin-like phospholipase family protein [candidate division WOR-3 bacterium]
MRFALLSFLLCALVLGESNVESEPTIRIGLALSGGGALGIAHVGVLKVLEEENITISYIVGNSMGALIGGLYAAGYHATKIESILLSVNWENLFSSQIPFGAQYLLDRQQKQRYIFYLQHRNFVPFLPSGVAMIQNAEFLLMRLLSAIEYDTDYDFDSLVIPYRNIAVDLQSGKRIIFNKGRLAQTIRASIAVPGVFAPIKIGEYELIDGGIISNLPVDLLEEFNPDLKIASLTSRKNQIESGSVIDVILQSINLIAIDDWERQKQKADLRIEPNVESFKNSDFHKAKELIKAGEVATKAILPELKSKIKNRKIANLRKKIIKRDLALIRSITFEGLESVNENIITQRMHLHKGDKLNFEKLIDDLTNIYYLNLFDHVDYDVRFNKDKDSVDLVIKLHEKAQGFYALGMRYDSFDGAIFGLKVGQGNIKNSCAEISATFLFGNDREIRLSIHNTRLYALPIGYRVDGYWRTTKGIFNDISTIGGNLYKFEMLGGEVVTDYILGKNAFFNIGLIGYQTKYEHRQNQEVIIVPMFGVVYNNLNDPYLPNRGMNHKFNVFYAATQLSTDSNFWKARYVSEYIIPFTSRFTMHPKFEIALSNGYLTYPEKFKYGGLNFLGFDKFEFVTNQALIISNSFDLMLFELFNLSRYPFYLSIFTNLATFDKISELIDNINFKEKFYWSFGIGIKTNTPIGPMQFAFSLSDFNKYSENRKPQLSLSIGREFRYLDG